ncbi:MAG: hypothetical protein LBD45_05745 [Bacteroidales bacterium]|nr:hypothetical protein [Bacteroidales bacterium]
MTNRPPVAELRGSSRMAGDGTLAKPYANASPAAIVVSVFVTASQPA